MVSSARVWKLIRGGKIINLSRHRTDQFASSRDLVSCAEREAYASGTTDPVSRFECVSGLSV